MLFNGQACSLSSHNCLCTSYSHVSAAISKLKAKISEGLSQSELKALAVIGSASVNGFDGGLDTEDSAPCSNPLNTMDIDVHEAEGSLPERPQEQQKADVVKGKKEIKKKTNNTDEIYEIEKQRMMIEEKRLHLEERRTEALEKMAEQSTSCVNLLEKVSCTLEMMQQLCMGQVVYNLETES